MGSNVVIGILSLSTIALLVATIVLGVQKGGVDAELKKTKSQLAGSTVSTATVVRPPVGENPCDGTKPKSGFDDKPCYVDEVLNSLEQAGANVSVGYKGSLNTTAEPSTTSYSEAGLCPVNVHWHLGAEHLSDGEYDYEGQGPHDIHKRRKLAGKTRQGTLCHHYDAEDEKFTKEYDWKYCVDMEVGQTYEVHWPHSKGGACGTVNQYQTPFYDGVFCNMDKLAPSTQAAIGVQAQVYTIVNDEAYYYPDMIRGMIVDGDMGTEVTKYTLEVLVDMEVGQTYEVHWPHSKGGACGTVNQYQTPFYDGVFCNMDKLAPSTQAAIGVQAQVYTIVNDEAYYYPDMIRGMIVDGDMGTEVTKYTLEVLVDMEVGQTYEVHWPHSKGGACGTVNQYQTPFYDGVFCNMDKLAPSTQAAIGVQAQVYTIVNDEAYYYPDMIRGMIVDGDMGTEVTKYTGSTTGTSRSNEVCSSYAPITWQVDRKCHLISASSFDKMCADMMSQRDDMSDDLYAHGSREVVADELAANNHQNLRRD
eukprot:CAMPEP_0113328514 /NCGR_PEP_ID=MMETSP0010_2-20120614/20082_1 /TAXON_ID=216773 ORGANISM="Corethron hystrix, Strain 308" /NCGR_SAMPLE_ID=MMETSP0010_2 /ASSEMBLY_ACC=CAM_ASM_000155 /LENGTH=529 /DNA_ID=CAMNT_0000189891 /DNA_START=12 /DNA_END=1603 /DNA_ORIENTATION=+ /assembly_acc=CAM_ASM_000155